MLANSSCSTSNVHLHQCIISHYCICTPLIRHQGLHGAKCGRAAGMDGWNMTVSSPHCEVTAGQPNLTSGSLPKGAQRMFVLWLVSFGFCADAAEGTNRRWQMHEDKFHLQWNLQACIQSASFWINGTHKLLNKHRHIGGYTQTPPTHTHTHRKYTQ